MDSRINVKVLREKVRKLDPTSSSDLLAFLLSREDARSLFSGSEMLEHYSKDTAHVITVRNYQRYLKKLVDAKILCKYIKGRYILNPELFTLSPGEEEDVDFGDSQPQLAMEQLNLERLNKRNPRKSKLTVFEEVGDYKPMDKVTEKIVEQLKDVEHTPADTKPKLNLFGNSGFKT